MIPKLTLGVSVLLSVVLFTAAGAQNTSPEIIHADDENIQEYKGKLGRWTFVPNKAKFSAFTKEYCTTDADVNAVNPGVMKFSSRYVFFPYGQEYLDKLAEKGIERPALSVAPDQFIWPVCEVVSISSVLGFRGREFHTGIDIPATRGSPVRAAMEGQVLFEGYSGGYGNMVDIQHRNGFITRYGHNTVVLVKKGDFVKKGQAIALVGSTGRSTGNHVHFEILCNTIPLDPMDFLPEAPKAQVVHQLKKLENFKSKIIPSMLDKIRRRESGILLYGITPPKKNTSEEKVLEITVKTRDRILSLPADGLVVYDIQDEQSRNSAERPFPFIETIDPYLFADGMLGDVAIPKIIYRASGKYSPDEFSSWAANVDIEKYASVLVGSPSSDTGHLMTLNEAYAVRSSVQPDLLTGGVLIPERHMRKKDEHLRMFDKTGKGCSFFITQCVYDTEASKNLLSDYYYESLKRNVPMVPVIFTLTCCGSIQTLSFMKWLGIGIPGWLENDLVHSVDILTKSVDICRRTALDLCSFCAEKKIPYGINIESVSIRKQEIEAAASLVFEMRDFLDSFAQE